MKVWERDAGEEGEQREGGKCFTIRGVVPWYLSITTSKEMVLRYIFAF